MLYRKLGKSGFNVSILGFGAMRLPIQGGSQSPVDRFNPNKLVDEEETIKMIEYAIGQGVNYFDTAYIYHGGKSEPALGKALKGYRNQVMLATKLPVMQATKREDFDRFLDEQLKRLDTNYLDVYLLHGLRREAWSKMKGLGVLKFLDQIQADGRARYVGFSFHDDVRIFKEIVDGYDWMLCQIQYNYYDEHYQAGREGLIYAVSKGLGVVVMEPLRGGKLTDPIPEEIQAIWDSAEVKRTPAEWGLRWVWNHPEVSIVLSGMSSMSQVIENIKLANDGNSNSLSRKELSIIDQVKETYKKMLKIDCTGCAYCMPCETGVNIPANFSMYNDRFVFKTATEVSSIFYNTLLPPEQKASNCAECGECEEKCPQHIKIKDGMKAVHQALFREGLQKK
ncbi:MAG: aldo/keto reductase [Deltaproteobacteria bacterium RBG_13_47_9]|nr:MAG: aldo/keto reductase [Deltaproteobacteria bacterium RBG_13_47_9]